MANRLRGHSNPQWTHYPQEEHEGSVQCGLGGGPRLSSLTLGFSRSSERDLRLRDGERVLRVVCAYALNNSSEYLPFLEDSRSAGRLQRSRGRSLAITNTMFKHKVVHLCSWHHDGLGRRSMIDFVVMSADLRPYVLDTRVKRGAELSTDHYLVVCWECLVEEPVRLVFNSHLRHSFDRVLRAVGDIESEWAMFRSAIVKAALTSCGCKATGAGRGADRYRLVKWAAAKMVGEAKTRAWEEFGIRGELLTSPGAIIRRWKEYFQKLLNPTNTYPQGGTESGDQEVDHPISGAEVAEIVKQLPGGGALGADDTRPGYLKALDVWISTSKSESMVLTRKKVECLLRVREEVLPRVEEFKYLRILFMSESRMERKMDRWIGAASAVMRVLNRTVMVKKELSWKAKLSIYQSIFVPDHELWVTERSRVQAAEMSFLHRVAGLSLRDRVRSSAIWEELRVELLLLRVERSQMRWLGHLVRMPPGRLPGEAFRACPSVRRPPGRPGTHWRDQVS
ncbi:hypothetical protein D4764_04G0010620 [Takifugu flavidus]|uniref:Endonuclease/exonuclease/phosphatase domain-containing protein n=1 Tax=Takifugu flavidus TaxID=433684 RepID=A0A5C6N5S1_9TELE|nr:hypothetical protein D4764_04G0010620 [Takifugu flavidus]